MTRSERQLLWVATAGAAGLVFAYEFFFMPTSIIKVIVCAMALVVMVAALFKRGRRRRRG